MTDNPAMTKLQSLVATLQTLVATLQSRISGLESRNAVLEKQVQANVFPSYPAGVAGSSSGKEGLMKQLSNSSVELENVQPTI